MDVHYEEREEWRYGEAVAEVGGWQRSQPLQENISQSPLYKIIKILTIFSLLLLLFFFFKGDLFLFFFPTPSRVIQSQCWFFLKVDLLSFNPPLIFFTCSTLARKEEEKIAEKEESKEKKKKRERVKKSQGFFSTLVEIWILIDLLLL